MVVDEVVLIITQEQLSRWQTDTRTQLEQVEGDDPAQARKLGQLDVLEQLGRMMMAKCRAKESQ